MKNKKTIIVIVVALIAVGVIIGLVLSFDKIRSLFAGASGGTKPEGVRVTNVSASSATIVWQTASPVTAQIEYGTTPGSFLLRATETTAKTQHNLTLSPLLPETIYYFRIRIGEKVYDENGAPYSFTTKSAKTKAAPTIRQQQTTNQPQPPQTDSAPTTAPTEAAPAPTTQETTTTDDQKYTLSDFVDKFGSDDPEFDINNDGVVNSQDWSLYQQQNP